MQMKSGGKEIQNADMIFSSKSNFESAEQNCSVFNAQL